MADYGFVYFLTNPSMPDIVKIGHTTKHPHIRAAEISRVTGCPQEFELLAYFGCWQPQRVEFAIHKQLEASRVNNAREFFKINFRIVASLIDQHFDEGIDCAYRNLVDGLIACEDYERSISK